MNVRSILRSAGRTAAVAALAGLLFAAQGSASASEGAHAATPQPRQTAASTGTRTFSGMPGDVQVTKDDAGNVVVTVAPYVSFLAKLAAH